MMFRIFVILLGVLTALLGIGLMALSLRSDRDIGAAVRQFGIFIAVGVVLIASGVRMRGNDRIPPRQIS